MSPRPESDLIQRGESAERLAFSPTSTFRIITAGGPGQADFFEEHSQRGDGPPLHRHPWPSWELVIEGRLRVRIGDAELVAEAGDAICVPADVPHTYVVESETARVVGINLSDGRFPRMQRAAVAHLSKPGPPDFPGLAAIAGAHGTEVMGPPMAVGGAEGAAS